MRRPALERLARLTLRATAALALVVAPCKFTIDGTCKIVAAAAHAGNGNGGGNGGGGNGGGNGGGGNSSGGNSGNSNAGGANANAGPGNNSGKGNTNPGSRASHVNASTGDTVEVDGDKITVVHRNGMKEEIENGRFEMTDAQGRTIIDRLATQEDLARLLSL
ncbi:Glycine-rich cell wall protein [Mesorhizobium sp. ORS 3324]|nr:Glycine-rich cell wall protein [Mesorhizobium sp. ORS 3324]